MRTLRLAGPIGLAAAIGFGVCALAEDGAGGTGLHADEVIAGAPADAWRPLDPENTLYLDLKDGRVVIELRPDFAPAHVARIKTLARDGFYDRLIFHRVIPGFMAQGGDPTGTGGGGSPLPDLPAEFTRLVGEDEMMPVVGRTDLSPQAGFVDGFPVAAQDDMVRLARADGKLKMWPRHCPGVTSMARADDPNSANSQFFLMFGDARRGLDQSYTAWGWVVSGMEHVMNIAPGEPPARPDQIQKMQVAADVPGSERVALEVMRTDSDAFAQYVKAVGAVTNGLAADICAIQVPVRTAAS